MLTGTDEVRAPTTARSETAHRRRWVAHSPVSAVAAILIAASVVWRADIASWGFLAQDDFVVVSRAAESQLTLAYLFDPINANHLAPGGLLITWLVTRAFGIVYWPYLLVLIVGQAVLSVAVYRLLRLLVRPGWGILIPLSVFLFTPLTLEVTSWWGTGMFWLPMQLAVVLAVGAQVKFIATGRSRHVMTLSLALLLGLLFVEKALLIAPLVFLVTATLFVTGGPIRSVTWTARRYWPSWLALTVIAAAYLALYFARTGSAVRQPTSPAEVLSFVERIIGSTLIPGIFGGPWAWVDTGDGAPITSAPETPRWLATAALLALVVVTTALRPVATRAWVLLAAYTTLGVGILAATRLGSGFSQAAGFVPRYVADIVVVAVLCIAVAMFGLRGAADQPSWHRILPPALREPGAVAVAQVMTLVVLVGLGGGAAFSAGGWAEDWAVKQGRDYVRTAQVDLVTAPPGTVFFDRPVPEGVVGALFAPYNMQSRVFNTLQPKPVFVAEAADPSMFDDAGHIRPMRVDGTETVPGPEPGCGYKIEGGRVVHVPLKGPMYEWPWFIRVGYLSSGESTATVRLGTASHTFDLHRGLQQVFFPLSAGGSSVEFRVDDPAVTVCLDQIQVGNAVPKV